ncbi:nicotinate-nucleotide adenylyltransferase [Hyphobacterium marinum]|uniref:Probable nicotinate-nucleotide adenylyltransferase n=1 Tax=Hyphobacterium marinum TaxID=3116574 RepID=A0ABU7LVS0_9PROT|nr:nicotinate-nucleotide adenylyltransferase [Hyphobacterium sp. Y6023]MEE2565647.1 nicotinate-nucleotide adenylyltransferase [Hyphobacterium sp. Y6023]
MRRRSAPVRFGALTRRGRSARPLKSEALAPGMTVGLFGGSFDPPHGGHLHVARTAMRRLQLDRVWWIVSPHNPLKARKPGEYSDRLARVAELASAPRMTVSDVENRMKARLTARVVAALVQRYPRVNFVWLMGADNLKEFHRWARWQEIMASLPVAVIARPQDPIRARLAPAARTFANRRVTETSLSGFARRSPPVWTYLCEPLHKESSSRLRRNRG